MMLLVQKKPNKQQKGGLYNAVYIFLQPTPPPPPSHYSLRVIKHY